MLIPKNILKLGKYATQNDGIYAGSEQAITIRRIGDDKLQAILSLNGHLVLGVTWTELPMEDFPLLPVTPANDGVKSGKPIMLQAKVCEQALKAIGTGRKTMPILNCLFVEEVERSQNGHQAGYRCFVTDLEAVSTFVSPIPDEMSPMPEFFDKQSNGKRAKGSKTNVNIGSVGTIAKMFQECLEAGNKVVSMKIQPGAGEFDPLKLTAEFGGVEAECYLMPMCV